MNEVKNAVYFHHDNQPKFPVAFGTCLMLRFVYSFLILAIKNDKQQLMKAYSIFTVD